jgi:hypothetical protein
MAYTYGGHTLAWNSRRAHSPRSIVLARISFLTTVHNLMLTLHMPMPTLTGQHAPKLDVPLVVLAFNLLAVQLLTNVSFSQQSPNHQQKQNSWLPMTQGNGTFCPKRLMGPSRSSGSSYCSLQRQWWLHCYGQCTNTYFPYQTYQH